jgi:hypothetical protein
VSGSSDREFEFDRLQRWMQAVITHPGGIGHGVHSPAAQREVAVDAHGIEMVVAPSATLTGAERLAIYSRSYYARLIECFRATFPALLHALGDDLFSRFAVAFLQAHPPNSYTLSELSAAFPEHLAATRPDAAAPTDARESWPDFLVDLATLERAVREVYDGPGLEGETAPTGASLDAMPWPAFTALRLVPSPALRLFRFRYAVHEYLTAVLADTAPELPEPHVSFVAVVRRRFRVQFVSLTREQFGLAQALDGSRTVADAIATAPDMPDAPADRDAVRAWVTSWIDARVFQSTR